MKTLDQKRMDHYRVMYELALPGDLTVENEVNLLTAVSGTLRGGPMGALGGTPAIAFELWASSEGIRHFIRIPVSEVDYVVPQLHKHGLRLTRDSYPPRVTWTKALELGLTNSAMPLRINDAADVSSRILASVQTMGEGERIAIQYSVTPVTPRPLPVHKEARTTRVSARILLHGTDASKDEVNARRSKLEQANFLATLRVGALASTPARAEHIIYNVRHALSSVRGPNMEFQERLVSRTELQRRLDAGSGSTTYGMQLSASELAALLAWPINNPFISGLAPSLTRYLPAASAIPRAGRVIGTSNMPGSERPVAVKQSVHAVRHVHVLGPNGTGKTTLLANMMAQDMKAGHGVILIESKGDLFDAAIDLVPDDRVNDCIILDVNDTLRPPGFNILDQGNSRTAVDELSALIASLYKESSASIMAPQMLYYMMHALADVPGATFVDLPVLLSTGDEHKPWREMVAQNARNRDVRAFMQRYLALKPLEQERMSAPVHNRTWEFTSRPEIKNIMGQSVSSFKMFDVIRDNKILLVNLNGSRVGKGTASIAGTLLVNAVWQAVKAFTPEKENFLYIDEFQDFTNLPVGMEDMLAKARSAKLGAVLAHQHTGQLRPEMRSAVFANTATKLVFQTSSDDARLMAREFGGFMTDQDFLSLGRFEAVARISTDKGVSPPVTLITHEPSKPTGNAARVRALSRERYGRPIEQVEAEIENRHKLSGAKDGQPRRRPRISSLND